MDHKFRQFSKNSLDLIDTMVIDSTHTTVDDEKDVTVTFPDDLYSQASKASDDDKLAFTVQVLKEVVVLFEEDHSSASWQESTVENFLNIMTQQADGLHSCIRNNSHTKSQKLHMYFKRLSHHVLKNKGHSAEAWELVRKEVKTHLQRTDQLVSSLLNPSA
ncbi:hypothetical protein Q5P01_023618 [Channa striata]|uniref:Interferon n=1 Tax=Channa striata TaxID=64152 RepID=A0AA88IUQ9_CHASR|nr:hypothetical protein Q5P01_023618 [Channa striata]